MAKIIYKHILVPNVEIYYFPFGAEILSVAAQHDHVVLYESHDTDLHPNLKLQKRVIKVITTGSNFDLGFKKFLGTVSLDDGMIMLHVFEY